MKYLLEKQTDDLGINFNDQINSNIKIKQNWNKVEFRNSIIRFFYLFIIIIEGLSLSAQNPDFGSMSIPPPNVASFTKFIDNPVNVFNGGTDLSLPVHSIKISGIEIPITLRYNTTGIKVSEEAGNVGLGWNLNVGGMITQNVIGQIDNEGDFNDIINYNSTSQNNPIYPQGQTLGQWSWCYDPLQTLYAPIDLLNRYGKNYDNVNVLAYGKGQPDIFYFNFLSYSGKFFIDYRDDKIYIVNKTDDIRFEQINNDGSIGWKAMTPDGAWYYFLESTFCSSSDDPLNVFNSRTFLLTKIVFPDGRNLIYEYESQGTAGSMYYLSESASQDVRNFCQGYGCSIYPPASPHYYYDSRTSYNSYELKVLKKIYSNDCNEEINLFYSSREDILNEMKVDSIVVKDFKGVQKKSYEFSYGYFVSPSGGNVWQDGDSDARRKRLKLLSFGQKGLPKHEFEYSEILLPSKQSYAQDYWGYYNGRTDNTSICSNFWSFYYFSEQPSAVELPWNIISYGSSRACDTSYDKAGLLKKITYPTNGYMSIEYESNTFENHFYPSIGQINEYHDIIDSQNVYEYPASFKNALLDYSCDEDDYYFDLDKTSMVKVNYTFNWSYQGVDFADIAGAYVKLSTRNEIYNTPIETKHGPIFVYFDPNKVNEGTFEIELEPGHYGIYTHMPDCGNGKVRSVITDVRITPLVYTFPDGFSDKSYGGGVRVASITQSDVSGGLLKTKYDYKGGTLMSPLNFYYSKEIGYAIEILPPPPPCNINCEPWLNVLYSFQYVTKTSVSFMPLSYDADGGLVGYNEVIIHSEKPESINDEFLNGSKKIEFNVFPPMVKPGSPAIPYLLNGRIKKQTLLDKLGNQRMVSEYDYDEKEFNRFYGHKESLSRLHGFYDVYPLVSSSINVKTKKDHYYDNNNVKYNEKVYNFTYNNSNLTLSKTENTSEDITKKISTNFFHIADLVNPTGTHAYMQDVNAIEPLVSKSVLVNNTKVYEETYDYRVGNNFYIPDDNQTFYSCNIDLVNIKPTGIDIEYAHTFKYDLKGNVIEQNKNDKEYTSYEWGYNESYLVSETKNSSVRERGYTNFENNELNGWSKYANSYNSFESSTEKVFTGKTSMKVISHSGPFKTFTVGRTAAENHSGYKASVWAKGLGAYIQIEVDGHSATQVKVTNEFTDGLWHKLEVELPRHKIQPYFSQGENLKLKAYVGIESGTCYFDDLRFHPSDAQMTTYTHEPLIGVTSISDENNKPVFYIYDPFGRLELIKDFEGNIIKKNDYHYRAE